MCYLKRVVLVAALFGLGCGTTANTQSNDAAKKEGDYPSIAAYVAELSAHASGCGNGDVVATDIDAWIKQGGNEGVEQIKKWRHAFRYESVSIGPKTRGLLVFLWTGAASGNGRYFLYCAEQRRLERLGEFDAGSLKLLPERVTNGFNDINTEWHNSVRGGPYQYWHWTGKAYEVYASGSTEDTKPN